MAKVIVRGYFEIDIDDINLDEVSLYEIIGNYEYGDVLDTLEITDYYIE